MYGLILVFVGLTGGIYDIHMSHVALYQTKASCDRVLPKVIAYQKLKNDPNGIDVRGFCLGTVAGMTLP
jgi:hypothetical protein